MDFLSEKAMWISFCIGVARFWYWGVAGVASVEEGQRLSCAGHSQFQMALDPSQAKAEPIGEVSAAFVKMYLKKDIKLQREEEGTWRE